MKFEQWKVIEDAIKKQNSEIPSALIIDSPWMPGYCNISTIDFYMQMETWEDSYNKIHSDFPDTIFFPDWWSEFGMACESSAYGCRISFFHNSPPNAEHIYKNIDEFASSDIPSVPDPKMHGLMPLLLSHQRKILPKLRENSEDVFVASTRGPLTIASHLMPLTELLIGVKIYPEKIHELLKNTTELCKRWLKAQIEQNDNIKAILVLDDVTGFFGDDDYKEFAHPYLKAIFDEFSDLYHFFHNDTDNDICFPYIESLGVDVFNFTYGKDIASAREKIGEKVCLMGNVPPMALVNKTPSEVAEMTKEAIEKYTKANGGKKGLILSVGGGVPMDAKKENIQALIEETIKFNRK